MVDHGKKNLLGVMISAVDYESAVETIIRSAQTGTALSVSALAVHGVMTGVSDEEHRVRLNSLSLVVPDGQPVRWGLNAIYGLGLKDRVYGPTLTLKVCEEAARWGIPIYLYGSQTDVVDQLRRRLSDRYPKLIIAGAEPSRFRRLTTSEAHETVSRIRLSGAKLLFVGLGCPRQEVFVYEFSSALRMPAIAVGAAFDYHSGFASEPPMWIQRSGLQWLHRLAREPRRLLRRYLVTNSQFCVLLLGQWLGLWRPTDAIDRKVPDMMFG